jgi:lysozyme
MAKRKSAPVSRKKKTPTSVRNHSIHTSIKERNIILSVAAGVLILMTLLHKTGLFKNLDSYNADRFYLENKVYKIKIPTLYNIHGIDVSQHQGKINWPKMIQNMDQSPTLDFVFIKACEGRTLIDDYFRYNWKEAGRLGMIRGAYHYLLPNKSGEDQAQLFLKTVDLQKGDLVPVCDIEITGGANKSTIVKNTKEWLQTIEKAVGKKPIIYSGKKFYEKYLADDFSDYVLWIAHYHVPELELETNDQWTFWQHNDSGHLRGVNHKVDFNVFHGTREEFNRLRI